MARTPKPPPSFEDALAELEAIVQSMESDGLSLEQSLERYQRGTELLRLCQGTLAQAEQRIAQLEGDSLKPFNPDSAGDAP